MSARQLRIAMLSVHSCPVGNLGAKDTGGMSVYIRELAHEMGLQGHSVDIYTRVHDPKDPQIVDLGQNARLIHIKAGEDEPINKLAVYSHLPDFTRNLESYRQDHARQYDLIFSHYWLSGWVGKHLQQWWGVPHIILFHTLGAVKNTLGIGEDEPELRIENEREAVQYCHRVIVTTEKEKETLSLKYDAEPEKISVVPCGVNLELFQPVDRETARQHLNMNGEKTILFVGRIEPLKGIEQLLRAMSFFTDRQRPRLVIIGGDEQNQPKMEELKRMCHDLRIQESVTFLGLMKHERLPYYYSAADACIIPSYYESFGLVALESLACGTPVVATDVAELSRIIHQEKAGYVVADNSPRHLAEKISLLLSRPMPDMNTRNSIRASVEHFGWANIAGAINRECQSVLADYMAPVP